MNSILAYKTVGYASSFKFNVNSVPWCGVGLRVWGFVVNSRLPGIQRGG